MADDIPASITPEEMARYAIPPSKLGADAGAPVDPGAVPESITPEEMARHAKHSVGTGEAAARSFYKHLTFGTEPFADKERSRLAAEQHPYLNVGMAVPAMVAQTAALGPLAAAGKAVQGTGALASTARGLGTAAEAGLLPNLGAKTAFEAARTGAKLGGNYSALEALGSGITSPDKSATDVARDVALSYGAGTLGGAALGAGAHGMGRVVGAIANRTMPDLAAALEAAKSPDAQGIRDILRHAGYDNADLARLEAQLVKAQTDPALAARYKDLNLLEALKAGDLKPNSMGELKPEVITTRNLDDLAKHAANTEGRGQNIAAEAFASRKNEMSAQMQGDIDKFFGSADRANDAAALATRRAEIGKRYEKLRASGKESRLDALDTMRQVSPTFEKAVRYAAENDAVANPSNQMATLWSGGKLAQGELSPSNMLDIHHYLVMNSKAKVGGDPAEAVMAGKLKNWFSQWADQNFAKHKTMREDYAQLRRVMDATEKGSELPPATGGPSHPSLQWLGQQQQTLAKAQDLVLKKQSALALAAQSGASKNSMNAYLGQVSKAQKIADNQRAIVDEFRKSYGESLKQFLAGRGENGPSQLVRLLTTQEGKNRLMQVLGPNDGRAFVESLYNKALQQRLGNTLYGNSDTAFKLQKRETLDALSNAASGLIHMRPKAVFDAMKELASSAYRQHRADKINELMAKQGVPEVLNAVQAANAQAALRQTGHPFVRNPLLRGLGALGEIEGQKQKQKP